MSTENETPTNPIRVRIDPLAPPPPLIEPPANKMVWFIPDRYKLVASAIVAAAGVGVAIFGTQSTVGAICSAVVAVGAAWGIVSSGTAKK